MNNFLHKEILLSEIRILRYFYTAYCITKSNIFPEKIVMVATSILSVVRKKVYVLLIISS